MKTIKRAILIFGTILSSFITDGQTIYYVSATGSDSNNGMLSTPWLTIQYGINQLSGGDTLNIMNGTYYEKLEIPVSGITLRNHTSANPVIDANGITSQSAIIKISNVSNTLIQGLELKNNIMLDAQGILVDGVCQNITIKNCIIHDIHFSSDVNAVVNSSTNAQGIIVYGTNATSAITNLKIQNNQLYNCRLGYSEGIAVNGNVDGFEVAGNTVYNLTNIGIDLIGHEGTCSNPANDQARNGFVKNNIAHHCISAYATSGGIYIDGGKMIIVENNTSYHNGFGIEVGCENIGKTTDAIIVRNNILYDNETSGLALGGYDYPGGSGKVINSSFRNNTCYYNDYSNTGNGEIYLSYSENSTIENNIFYTSNQNIIAFAELMQPTLSFNYNVFYCQSGMSNLSAEWNGNSYTGYSSFVTGTGSNINSIFTNPLFVSSNTSTPDFHILSTSGAINAGNPAFIPASGEVDMDGENRANGIIDCGADEFYSNTGIMENTASSNLLKIFPNPSGSAVTITISGSGLNIKRIIIYDCEGRQVSTFSNEINPEIQVNVSAYQAGQYYVVACDKFLHTVNTQKLIIE